jgi:hypothetical protein
VTLVQREIMTTLGEIRKNNVRAEHVRHRHGWGVKGSSMPRSARLDAPGILHHVIGGGIDKGRTEAARYLGVTGSCVRKIVAAGQLSDGNELRYILVQNRNLTAEAPRAQRSHFFIWR